MEKYKMRRVRTLGYEGSNIEDFCATLRAASVDYVIDVRERALSRKKGFSKKAFAEHLAKNGIRYVHLRGLGDPKAGRDAAKNGDYQLFRKIFGAHLLTEKAQSDLAIAIQLCSQWDSCLVCFERDPAHCHRTIVAKLLMEKCRGDIQNLYVSKKASRILNASTERRDTRFSEGAASCW
ncbi:MAG: DUF488 family protein [Rhodospirillales bacterium]